jgi:16S rRNA (cytosine1402-N4)-methyltransferase
MIPYHIPVLLKESLELLIHNPKGLYVDCTFGGGGHTRAILDNFPNACLIAFDRDNEAFENYQQIKSAFGERLTFVKDNFKNIKNYVSDADGILADIGVSSRQFDELERGFSFNSGTLDMRMDTNSGVSAKEVVNSYPETDLADIIYKYGEEHYSRQIAKAIVASRRKGVINSGISLAQIVENVKWRKGKIHPATQTFQALRIYVNGELENLEALLLDFPKILKPHGRIAVISYHSLEDKIVKYAFKKYRDEKTVKILTKKAVTASVSETRVNPRARSAKLRAAEVI